MTAKVKKEELTNTQVKILEEVGKYRKDLKETTLDLDDGIDYLDRFGGSRYPYMKDSLYLNDNVKPDDVEIVGKRKRWFLVGVDDDNVIVYNDENDDVLYSGSFLDADYNGVDNDVKVVLNLLKNTYNKGKSFPFENKNAFVYRTYGLSYHNDKGEDMIIFPGGKEMKRKTRK